MQSKNKISKLSNWIWKLSCNWNALWSVCKVNTYEMAVPLNGMLDRFMLAILLTGKIMKNSNKVKQFYYRPRQALRVPGGWGTQISRQSAHEGGKFVSPTHWPPLPQEIFLILISVRGWVNPRAIVRPEEICQWKIPVTPSVIEPATFRSAEHCVDQLRHRLHILVFSNEW
jgi:hypothetical protein